MEAWQLLWIVLMFTTGGLNAIIGSLGFTMFRGACRYSIVILAITLLYAARRLSAIERTAAAAAPDDRRPMLWNAVAAVLCLLILWDQVPPALKAEKTAIISRQIDADRQFTARMEAALPAGAMVFQLPIMEFPEAPAPGVPPYDHLRPYLFGNRLRYSFGGVKGRPDSDWQKDLARLPSLEKVVEEIKGRGFAAIYINRNGFPDRAKAIEEKLLEMGYSKPPIRNASGELSCILLEKD
jgi:phosphoglycerol transferase